VCLLDPAPALPEARGGQDGTQEPPGGVQDSGHQPASVAGAPGTTC